MEEKNLQRLGHQGEYTRELLVYKKLSRIFFNNKKNELFKFFSKIEIDEAFLRRVKKNGQ